MHRKTNLVAFIEGLNTYQLIYTFPFLELFDGWFSEKTDNLIEEVIEELLLFQKEQQTDYLKMVKYKLARHNIFNNDPSPFLQNWIEEYGLEGLDFPFTENTKILKMLSLNVGQETDYKLNKDIANIQIDFFCYSASLEYQKAVDFIDRLLKERENPKQIQPAAVESQMYPNSNVDKSSETITLLKESSLKIIREKWYALHYLLEQKSLGKKLPITREGTFNKAALESIGKERSGRLGQSFYKYVRDHSKDIEDAATIKRVFGEEWKQNVIELSKNDTAFVKFLEANY